MLTSGHDHQQHVGDDCSQGRCVQQGNRRLHSFSEGPQERHCHGRREVGEEYDLLISIVIVTDNLEKKMSHNTNCQV